MQDVTLLLAQTRTMTIKCYFFIDGHDRGGSMTVVVVQEIYSFFPLFMTDDAFQSKLNRVVDEFQERG
jgi:hypothetical protein